MRKLIIVALLVFGPGKLPEIGSGSGKAIRDFKKAFSGEEPVSCRPKAPN